MGIYKDLNDYEVMYLVEENDDSAQELLFEKYEPIIKNVAAKYKDDAKKCGLELDDLIQEGYLGLYNAIKSYDANQDTLFYTYAIISIRSRILNCLTKKNAIKLQSLNNSISLFRKLPNTDDEKVIDILEDKNALLPHLFVESNEFQNNIHNFLLSLNFYQSCILELEINGFSNQDIQKLLDIPLRTVSNNLFQIRKKLKDYLQNDV
jgi:RNA polymerase sporulation-specific sigma factor